MKGSRTCQLSLTKAGDVVIHPIEDPFAFVFILPSAIGLTLHELSSNTYK